MADPPHLDPLARLRALTHARIGLGRAGQGLPTAPMLDFQLAHARARDAVHAVLDAGELAARLTLPSFVVHSAAADRATYLQNPDLGRRLAEDAVVPPADGGAPDLSIVIGDGLSATAVSAHAAAVVDGVARRLGDWRIGPVCIAHQARVALGDAIGQRAGAGCVLVLIGERPGLSAADSLGAYLTWQPRIGRRDSERNCVSNIRAPGGYAPDAAADKLAWLLREARRLGLTGVALKDRHDAAALGAPDPNTLPPTEDSR